MADARLVELGPRDADEIVALEQRSFIPALQAKKETVLKRFGLGHHMLGLRDAEHLIGMISFSYGNFDPRAFAGFPKTLEELCLQVVPEQYNAAYVYNLEVEPSRRGGTHAKALIWAALRRAEQEGCTAAVANCRVPSYRGSTEFNQEHVPPSKELRRVIDAYLNGGRFPAQQEFLLDPLLALYHRITGCTFLRILPYFAPADDGADPLRVIAYGRQQQAD